MRSWKYKTLTCVKNHHLCQYPSLLVTFSPHYKIYVVLKHYQLGNFQAIHTSLVHMLTMYKIFSDLNCMKS